MSKQLSTLLKALAEKVGIDVNDTDFVNNVLNITATVPDALYGKLETGLNGLMDLEAAKNNNQLHQHFKANVLKPLDSELERLLEELGLDDASKAELLAEKSTYKKPALLLAKVRELESKKASATGGDKKALQDEINKLNAQIADARKAHDAALAAEQAKAKESIKAYALEAYLGTKHYADSIPEAIRVSGANALLQNELAAKGAKLVLTDENKWKLVRADNPELDYMENNSPVQFGAWTDKLLSTHAMLKVSGAGKPGTTPNNNPAIPPANGEGQNTQAQNANLQNLAALEKQLGG
jgi:hypothetical protein